VETEEHLSSTGGEFHAAFSRTLNALNTLQTVAYRLGLLILDRYDAVIVWLRSVIISA